ncbi:MAG: orotidine-5'-phosphate decarboxylase [Aminivibrio sp.]|jgi:orotidine-5'-phosphate decarboxylase
MTTGLDRLILALDVDRTEEARELLSALRGELKYVKIGHGLYARGGLPFLREVTAMGYSVFLDIKLHDIPNTVFMAVDILASEGLWALTLHSGGGRKMLEEARRAKEGRSSKINLLGVTVLTSFDEESWEEAAPGCSMGLALERRASLCREAGMDGIVCSPLDLAVVKAAGGELFTVVPGVRPTASSDDQARQAAPGEAVKNGADYLVVGRPILKASDRASAARAIAGEIEEALAWTSRK